MIKTHCIRSSENSGNLYELEKINFSDVVQLVECCPNMLVTSCWCDKIPDENSLGKEVFILLTVQRSSPSWGGSYSNRSLRHLVTFHLQLDAESNGC